MKNIKMWQFYFKEFIKIPFFSAIFLNYKVGDRIKYEQSLSILQKIPDRGGGEDPGLPPPTGIGLCEDKLYREY